MDKPTLSRIRIYPIKSLDPVELQEAEVGVHSLLHDREYALLTDDGRFMNGKRSGRVNELKTKFNISEQLVSMSLRSGGSVTTFHLQDDRPQLETYLRDFFQEPITLIHNKEGQLMDIPEVSSVTVISEASFASFQSVLPGLSLEDIRLRFRASLELTGVSSFWEENLVSEPGTAIRFQIGDVEMLGVSPRARCNVPPRDPQTGVTDKYFIRKIMESRRASLPKGSMVPLYGTLYQLSVNVFLSADQKGKVLRVGDPVTILEQVDNPFDSN